VKEPTDKFVQCFIQISLSVRRLACYPSIYIFSFINKADNVHNTEALSCDHFCSGKAISFTNYVCICCRRYLACNALALYCRLWPARLHNIFLHYLVEGTTFENKIIEGKIRVVIFSTIFI